MPSTSLTLYELVGTDPDLRFSPHCWKTRMALAHKGLEAERVAWHFTEKDRIAFSGQGLVPVLIDGSDVVSDSWRIALHLEARFPDRPSLFGDRGAIALTKFINSWADSVVLPAVARVIVLDIHRRLGAKDGEYFRLSREKRFGKRLEDVVADRPARLSEFRKTIQPLRQILAEQDFIAGTTPAYADYCLFGMFMWARCSSDVELLPSDDPAFPWRERLLDGFGGMARAAPSAHS